ncbi:hypothetical protein EDEG_00847 [Edhazardia aedis USNM 41457]|uniref:Homeobox domain-containing protein n=1 Tax=Edhazardia aedis (strain USNM 41457) TaxID=1003232 RepID=J9DBH2_EDHAE|nr:hypothetical protein EDEG_00847 [Edhazardia aedis USNM 41457]|eukprot:EJW05066.1 hypothetical protein EDEG_00847 [Edhazardia aedis USNM 41457]
MYEEVRDERGKKKRVRLSSEKTLFLQQFFDQKPRPTTIEKRELAKKLQLNFRSVQVWFQNRRAKCKKDLIERSSNHPYPQINRSLATNNSLFTRRDTLMHRPFIESYPTVGSIYNYPQNTSIPFYNNLNPQNNDNSGLINFYDNDAYKPRKMFKFHDCSDNPSFIKKQDNTKDHVYNNSIYQNFKNQNHHDDNYFAD